MLKKLKDNFSCKIDATGLAIFRMLYAVVLMWELRQLYHLRLLIYGKLPFIEMGAIDVEFIFQLWFIIITLIFFGLLTRIATIINYIFSVVILSANSGFEYHVFYTYLSVNLLLMFIPVSRVCSLDALVRKLKYSSPSIFYVPDRKVLAVNYYVLVLVGLGFVYFDSILFKFNSPMWLKGLGVWLPASLPFVTWNDNTWILNKEILIKGLSYFTLFFETIFIFTFWFKAFRTPLLLTGIFLHLGILIVFPIPLFALTAMVLYIVMVPVGFWKKFGSAFKRKVPVYSFYYDAECPLCIKTVTIIRHFDILNSVNCLTVQGNYQDENAFGKITEEELLINIHGIDKHRKVYVGYAAYSKLFRVMGYIFPLGFLMGLPGLSELGKRVYAYIAGNRITERCTTAICPMPSFGLPFSETDDFLSKGFNRLSISKTFWKYALLIFFLFQIIISWFSPLSQEGLTLLNVRSTRVNAFVYNLNNKIQPFITKFLGLSQHGVFLDYHFSDYNHIFKIEYCDEKGFCSTVPIIDDNGMPGKIVRGSTWCNFTFNVVSSDIQNKRIEAGFSQYLNFFKFKYLPLSHAKGHFVIYEKEIAIPTKWERDFLRHQITRPWEKVGEYNQDSGFTWNKRMEDIFISETK